MWHTSLHRDACARAIGFLGVCIIPANVLLDTGSLGQGATGVVTFRLKKIRENDSVTGKLVLKVGALTTINSRLAYVLFPVCGSSTRLSVLFLLMV